MNIKTSFKRSKLSPQIFLVLTALFLNFSSRAEAAACCAGNGAAPAILPGDEIAQVSVSVSRGTVIGDAPARGIPIFRKNDSSEVTETYLISGAHLLADRWQAGAQIPIIGHGISSSTHSGVHSTGIGDIRLNTSYEILPEWTYSVWKPHGFAFLQLTLPTGKSIYDSQTLGAVDASGKGFYTLGPGGLFIKRWSKWDIFVLPEAHWTFSRKFESSSSGITETGSGWGGSFALGIGVSPGSGDFRVGFRIQPVYESGKNVSSSGTSQRTSYQLSWNTALEATYLIDTVWSLNAQYTDQTLLGPAVNTTLSRTFALGILHRWER